jgi:hypothetical protein
MGGQGWGDVRDPLYRWMPHPSPNPPHQGEGAEAFAGMDAETRSA